jgi:sugar phosphate permease
MISLLHLRPQKVFYGWWIVAASFLISLFMGGVVFYGFTAFFEPIADDLGWSYTQISLAASLRGLEWGLLAPIVGMISDRWGPRRLIFVGVIITTVGLILLSATTSLGMFYVSFVLIAIGSSACTVTVLMTALASWFRSKIGIASGIAICGFGLSGLMVPVAVKLIDVYEWRMALTILALGMMVVSIPLSLLFRHKPEQYGQFPDGQVLDPATHDGGSNPSQAPELAVKTKQALKSGTFWRLALAFTYHLMVISAVTTHVMPYLSSIGLARSTSSLVATAVPLTSIGGRLGLGWLADKMDSRLVTAGAFTMIGLGLLCFGYVSTTATWLLVPFAILLGVGYGGNNTLRPTMGREYFGRANFGAIFGLTVLIGSSGGITGPIIAGWIYDNWGSYQAIWIIFAALAVLPAIAVLTIKPIGKGKDKDRIISS